MEITQVWGHRQLQWGLSYLIGLLCGAAEELLNPDTLHDSVWGKLAVSGDSFSCHQWGGGVLPASGVEAEDAAKSQCTE